MPHYKGYMLAGGYHSGYMHTGYMPHHTGYMHTGYTPHNTGML